MIRGKSWKDDLPEESESGFKVSDRAQKLIAEFANHATVKVYHSKVTLEYDLAEAGAENAIVMAKAWEACFEGTPGTFNSAKLQDLGNDLRTKALLAWRGICRADHIGSKAEFAQRLAATLMEKVEDGDWIADFEVPLHFRRDSSCDVWDSDHFSCGGYKVREPTPEQKAVLERKDARVRLVRSCPGSGKTWLVAEVIRRELSTWLDDIKGIAGLSFTRVGGDEIRKAAGRELGHPHFVGTIDAFLFRYVIRPHLRQVFKWFAEPRIVAGEWGAENWGKYAEGGSSTVGTGINLFGCVYIGEEQGNAVVAYKSHPAQPLKVLLGPERDKVKEGKIRIWKKCGLLTHSDAALWASRILEHETFWSDCASGGSQALSAYNRGRTTGHGPLSWEKHTALA